MQLLSRQWGINLGIPLKETTSWMVYGGHSLVPAEHQWRGSHFCLTQVFAARFSASTSSRPGWRRSLFIFLGAAQRLHSLIGDPTFEHVLSRVIKTTTVLGVTFPFCPGILLSSKPPKTLQKWLVRWLKRMGNQPLEQWLTTKAFSRVVCVCVLCNTCEALAHRGNL